MTRGDLAARHRPVLGAAALTLGLVAVASYAGQRLWSAYTGVEGLGVVVRQVHIPYFWRCDLALLHGLMGAALVGFGLDEAGGRRLMAAGPWLVLVVVLPSAVAMVLVP